MAWLILGLGAVLIVAVAIAAPPPPGRRTLARELDNDDEIEG